MRGNLILPNVLLVLQSLFNMKTNYFPTYYNLNRLKRKFLFYNVFYQFDEKFFLD